MWRTYLLGRFAFSCISPKVWPYICLYHSVKIVMMKKKITYIFYFICSLTLQAQEPLEIRNQWNKNYGPSLSGEVALGWPVSRVSTGGTIIFNFPYRLCASRCSTAIVYRGIARDSLYKTEGRYTLGAEMGFPLVNGYFSKLASGWDETTQKFYTTTTYYSPDFNKIGQITQQNPAYITSVNPQPNGSLMMSTSKNTGDNSDSLVRLDAQGRRVWAIATESYSRSQNQTNWNVMSAALPKYQGEEAAFISFRTIYDFNNSSTILSQKVDLKVVKGDGTEKWSVTIESPLATTKVIGTDAEGQWYVLTQRDSVGRLLTYSGEGKKSKEVMLSMPGFNNFNFGGADIQKTADEGFVLFNKNIFSPFFAKYSKTGTREWSYQMPSYLEQVKITSTGNIVAYTHYLNQYQLVLLSPTGREKAKLTLFHLLESKNGWLYGTTLDKLYAVNPQGEIAWTINRPSSRAVVSEDRDENLLLTETFSIQNPKVSDFLGAWGLDVVNTFSLTKYTKEGKMMWRAPITLPVNEPNYQVRFLAGTYPSKDSKDAYLLTSMVLTASKNAAFGNQSNIDYSTSVIKISRPCYAQLAASLSTNSPSLCSGQTVKMVANADFTGFLSYQWQRDGQTIITNRQNIFETTTEGVYRVTLRDSVCGTSSTSSTIDVKPPPIASVSLVTPPPVYAPNKAKLQANEGVGLTHQWLKNGQEIGGATMSSLETVESGTFSVKVTKDGCSRISPPLTVEIVQPLGIEGTTEIALLVSPNPNWGEFELKLPEGWEEAQVHLYDLMGNELPVNHGNGRVTVKTTAGIYWLKTQLGEKKLSQKVVIRP